jgi:hypothetical protein
MRHRPGRVLMAILFTGLCWEGRQDVQGLTIYRIGGAGLPPPGLAAEEGVEFVQLDWADVDEKRHGSTDLLETSPDFIEPQRLDPDDNLTPLLEARGGQILILTWNGWAQYKDDDIPIFDEDPSTAYLGDGHYARVRGYGPQNKFWVFDFGGRFFIQRIRFYPRQRFESERFLESFKIGTSDGDPLKDGRREYTAGWGRDNLDFDIVYDIRENTRPVMDLELPPRPIQRLLFEAPENVRGIWEIAEFEIYGGGYVPQASYISDIIDLGGEASLGEISWKGSQGPGAKIELSTRSGLDDDPNTYWRHTFRGDEKTRFDEGGKPLTLETYDQLDRGQRAGITHDTANWDFWSSPFEFAVGSDQVQVDRPRRFVQVRANFSSTAEVSGHLEHVQFAVSEPPVASQAMAEIVPVSARAGEETEFTFKLLPRLRSGDLGFDTIEMQTPDSASVLSVRVGGMDRADFAVTRRDGDGFEVRIPRIDVQRTGELVEVVFRTKIYKYGTVFAGRIFDSERPHEVRQRVTEGDADRLSDGNALRVELIDVTRETIGALRVSPAVFTPNGDGINDEVRIEGDLLNLFGDVPVTIDLYDLAGRKLGELFRGTATSGRFSASWNGRDVRGELFPPGSYILNLGVETDRGKETRRRVISLAY